MPMSSCTLAAPFRADVAIGHDEAIVKLAGELDIDSADALERTVAELHTTGHDRIVVDLSRVEFIDSTGLRVLLGLHRSSEREGRLLGLVRGPRPVHRMFELTATAPLFHWR